MFRKKKDKEEAVSPVIGTVLLLGLTVILVSIVSIYVFDMVGETPEHHNVVVTTKLVEDTISLTYQGGSGDNSLSYFKVNLYKSNSHKETKGLLVRGPDSNKHLKGGSYTWLDPQIGETIKIEQVPLNERVTVIGYFESGSTQLVLDRSF